ncbi:MAG: hypothetical protein KIT84_02360 [Labilithrix sp.]|nr:hypothetical protein [Labilithrix sp.]MCW5809828.1 hypothetical protein [Labilithrix sp.]
MTSRRALVALGLVAACGVDVAALPPPGDGDASAPEPKESSSASSSSSTSSSSGGGVDAAADGRAPEIVEPAEVAGVDVVTLVKTGEGRRPISPLIYGINGGAADEHPVAVMAGVSFVRRGGDRSNAYNWETNVSNGSHYNGFVSDMYLTEGLAQPNAPGAVDLELIAKNRAAGRATMVPFVLNDYVSASLGGVPYDQPAFDREDYFERLSLVKPTAFADTPDLNDGKVYTDEHLDFLRRKIGAPIFDPGPTQVMVGTDNEPDLFGYNFPMLQLGSGVPLYADNGALLGRQLTGAEFTARYLVFATRVKELAPNAMIVGPDHYHFDGWTTWYDSMPEHSGLGTWYMDEYLAAVKAASDAAGKRLLDTWDFHWYPQRIIRGKFVWELDHGDRALDATELEAILQGPRSYWDPTWDEQSWITRDHLFGGADILTRLFARLEKGYPGTKLGVTEYFPGGCRHVASGLAVADTLGVFARMDVHVAAMWPACADMTAPFGGLQLMRNADGKGARFGDTNVAVEHPERAESSVFAAEGDGKRVTVVVVNKTNAPRRFGIRLFGAERLARVTTYRIDATHASPHPAGTSDLTLTNAYTYEAPALSASHLVFTR